MSSKPALSDVNVLYVLNNPKMKQSELAALFGCSECTIRNHRARERNIPRYKEDIEARIRKSMPSNRFYRPFQDGTYST